MEVVKILISGAQGSGKTTLANYVGEQLQNIHGYFVNQITFAHTIYRMHDQCLKILKELGIERRGKKDGELLQLLGTEWGRNCLGENIWVECAKGQVQNAIDYYEPKDKVVFIFSDCRFKNEFNGFTSALKVRLECNPEERRRRVSYWRENQNHPSETDLNKYSDMNLFDLKFDTSAKGANSVKYISTKIIEKIMNDPSYRDMVDR